MPEQTVDDIRVLGSGMLASAITATLTTRSQPRDSGQAGGLVIVASDGWDTSDYPAARQLAQEYGSAWLPVRTELSHAVVGPLERPGQAGCVTCAELRRNRIRPDRAPHRAVWRQHRSRLAQRRSTWLTGLAADLVATLVADDVETLVNGQAPRTRGAIIRVSLEDLSVTTHRFLPDPLCPVCGQVPDDAPELATITLTARPAHRPGSYRTRPVHQETEELFARYVDEAVGLIPAVTGWTEGAHVVTAAPVGFRNGGDDAGWGRAHSLPASRLIALLEALERYGCTPGGRRTTVTASYQEVRDDALDPRTLGLYPPERYDLPGFHYRPFRPDHPYRWVWGWSFHRQRPVLVPEQYAYYGVPHGDDHGFVYEISNGCALGGSLEEAILYGLLEIAERDAFLLTWYARLPAARIDLDSAADPTIPLLAAAMRAETGYEVHLFDTTTEVGIPCAWSMAVNPRSDGRPALTCAAGAHPDPKQAVRNALAELGPGIAGLAQRYSDPAEAQRAREMVEDPALVRTMQDHALLYADPAAAARLDFLLDSPATRAVAEIGRPDRGGFAVDDLRDNLLEAVSRFTEQGMDVVVVDQTTPEHRAGGFACVKVVVPGALPMTFGHQYRRVDGLPRLYRVPHQLGYRRRPLTPDEVNPHPHPFP